MLENFTAIIGAKIRDFQNKMKIVDKKVRETAMEATKPIDADINDFYASILEVESLTKTAVKKATKKITLDINDFYTQMAEIEAETKIALKPAEKSIRADISNFMRKAAEVAVVARNLVRDKVVITIEAKINKFQATISRIASTTRAFGELMQTTMQGIGMSLAPAIVPLIATLGGLLGQLGPMLGTIAGSTFALGSAFGVAGIAAGAFTGLMVSNLKSVFKATDDVAKIQEKLADETDNKKRVELLEKIKNIQGGLTAEQMKAYDAMGKLSSTWDKLSNSLQTPVIKIFTDFLGIMGDMVRRLTPMFQGSVKAVDTLTTSLGKAFKGERMMAFFKYLNTSAAPMLETMGKAVGNFIQGIFSMMTAFSGLTTDTSNGFLAMSESFATWAAGLGESKKFQSFVDYVKENMPKIRSIFSDAFQGIINIFAGFAPSSADMMTSLESMMERFKEWSSTISANQGFQKFIDYIKENGPQTVALIGNVVTSIVNIGIALAPMGAKILELVNSFISWTNEMMKSHPILGKIGAVILVMTGLLIAIAPNIIAFGTLFGGVATAVGASTSLMRGKFVTGMAMMVTSMVKTAAAMVVNTAKMVAQWVIMGTKSTIQAIKVASAWTLSTGAAMATSVGKMIATSAVFVAKWVWMGVQALAQAARMAAAWFIALGPIGWVTAAIIGLAILIIANWDKIKAKTIEIWTKVSASVKEAAVKMVAFLVEGTAKMIGKLSEFVGKVLEFRSKMLNAGKDLIRGLIDGAISMAKNAVDSIKQIAGDMVDAALSFFKIKSPSRVFMSMGEFISKGLAVGVEDKAKLAVASVSNMASAMTNAFTPNLLTPSLAGIAMTPMDTQSQMDSLHRQIKQELSVDMNVNHKGQGGPNNSTQAPILYVTIDAKNVKEINDVVKLFDQQQWDS